MDYGLVDSPEYGAYETAGGFNPAISDQNFFQSALQRIQGFAAPIQRFSESPVGSQIMEAIYNYGAGKIDVAREKAVGAFLMTAEGQKIQQEATRQTISQYSSKYMPLLWIAGGFLLVLLLARR